MFLILEQIQDVQNQLLHVLTVLIREENLLPLFRLNIGS